MLCLSNLSSFLFASALLVWLQFIVWHSFDDCSATFLNNSLIVEGSSSSSHLEHSLYEKATEARQLNCTTATVDYGNYHTSPNGTLYVEAIDYNMSCSSYSREGNANFVCEHDIEFKRLKFTWKEIYIICLALIVSVVHAGIPLAHFLDWRCIILSAFTLSLITFSAVSIFNMQEILSPFSFFIVVARVSSFIYFFTHAWKIRLILGFLLEDCETSGFIKITGRKIEVLSFTAVLGIIIYITVSLSMHAVILLYFMYVLSITPESFNGWLHTNLNYIYYFIDYDYWICVFFFIVRCILKTSYRNDSAVMIDPSFGQIFLITLRKVILYFMSSSWVCEYGCQLLFIDEKEIHWFLFQDIRMSIICAFSLEYLHLLFRTGINEFLIEEQGQSGPQVMGG